MSVEPVLKSAWKSFKEGDIKTALLDLKTAKGMAPDDYRVYYYYGRCYLKTKDNDKAVENLNKAFEMNPTGQISYFLGRAHVRKKDWQKVVEVAEKGLEKSTSDQVKAAINFLKSGAHMELGQKDEAINAAQKAVELSPEDEDFKKHLEYLKK
ncbi:MAG: tetratricopeptide repeat protein [Candidatus Lokiarchaeota archaeon]|nr:tetratricopeptide repeat protein [Candidatus Lokiarchaeota archaeon]